MDFAFPPEVSAFRQELGRYLDASVTPELLEECRTGSQWGGPLTKAFWRKLGADGYFGTGWPVEYGGGGKSLLYLYAFNYEMSYRRLPVPLVTLNTVAPTIMRIGTEEQKQEYLPKILRGEIEFAIGYTEPEAGTDLASLKTQAVRDGDSYVINGQKLFTSGADHADYVWLAVRTDPEAPKHRGISVLVVPPDAEGVEGRPLPIMSGTSPSVTFYDNVRVPLSNLVGEENMGWRYITTQLDFERVAISPVPEIARMYDTLVGIYREDGLGGGETWTKAKLVEIASELNMLRWLDQRIAAMVANGEVPVSEASMIKVLSNELKLEIVGHALQMLGPASLIRFGESGALLDSAGRAFEAARRGGVVNLFGGGSNDVQRDLMGSHGLGLPR